MTAAINNLTEQLKVLRAKLKAFKLKGTKETKEKNDKHVRLNIRLPTGRVTVIDIRPANTVHMLKTKVLDKERIPIKEQRLQFNNLELANRKMLKSYGIVDGDVITLSMPVVGGGKRGKQATISEHDIVEPMSSDPPEVVEALTSVNFQCFIST